MTDGKGLITKLRALGAAQRATVGERDLADFVRMRRLSEAAQLLGRALLLACAHSVLSGSPVWFLGMGLIAFYLAIEAQLNHTVQHGVFVGVEGAESLRPERYESLALPFRTATWREAHRIHHGSPSLLERDPDTHHDLFRLDRAVPLRALRALVGIILVFELWAVDYDRFLKRTGRRAQQDRSEVRKLALFFAYQYGLWALLAGRAAGAMLLATACAVVLRNLIFVGLQLASSVGVRVSRAHALTDEQPRHDAWVRFQVETSKNFPLRGAWRVICGGLDRHIEHHLFPDLPPARLHALAPDVRALCERAGIRYEEHSSIWASLRDSAQQIWRPAPTRDVE